MKNFNQYLQSKNLSANTIKAYLKEIDHYTAYLKSQKREVENTTPKDLISYLQKAEKQRKIVSTTKQRIVGVLKHYYHYLNQYYELTNITHLIKIRGAKKKQLRQLLSTEELEQLCDGFYYENRENTKDYLLLSFAAYQGLTATEINRLTLDDIDLRKGTIKIQATKRSNGRTLSLAASQIGVLMQYLNEATDFKNTGNRYQILYKQLRKLSSKFEDFKQIRGSVITSWIQAHGLRKAQYLAGHRYISSTEHYLANNFESLQKELENFHPLG